MTEIAPSVLITGASSGLGAVYADRFARRGYNLVLVARDAARLEKLAIRLRVEYSVEVDILPADLAQERELDVVAKRLECDTRISILVNNAGISLSGTFTTQTPADIDRLIAVNLAAVVRLSRAVAPRLVQAGTGSIINISSVVGLAPEFGLTIYGATKAFVLFLSQGLSLELAPHGVYVQAVLPAVTRTEIWARAGKDINSLGGVMEAEELVDAALSGFDLRETVTIPPLHEEILWNHHEQTRQAMLPEFSQEHAAKRYLTARR
ncbi:TPA: SDR family oxidoreductase [Serratia marcescens]|jgi:Short-chain dehydrogenases of various substrate specificities|uniref:SDR family NAD(P)-dependent oxidoreductase n=1 Tax=Serratia TaxID=613 RepID=UPI000F7D9286|nr:MULTISPECIES: SDR family oxidoreductase [Serratia]EIY8595560.1 SDR family oxidoreductase [Serratia marcescens]EIY8857396.1 SDR family oxidoreductase [Serratia marcescens]EIY8864867.1 SDR family oxidoreductase [Serratia marcescens]EIY9016885.1 SDR family oxidoreductase [Serratia marcescens]ELY3098578.1 SDR family oxidoreductase [Serratia marcescens]